MGDIKMTKYLSLFLILVFMSGCVGAQIKAPQDNINKIQRIAVVPLEPPPIEIPPFVSSAPWFRTSAFMATIPRESIQGAGRVGVMVFGIFMLMELPEAVKRSAKIADSLETMLDSGEAWIPTIVFAQEAAKQITAQGKHDVAVIQNVQKFRELVNRERTWHLENWYAPIRSWFNEEVSQFDYKSLHNQRIDAVLEIGMLHYVLIQDHIGLQVMLKLIDPLTGQVLGRARAYDVPAARTEGILENNGQKFKDMFGALGAKLITQDLKSIGLLPE
jgi:hypothetical protein